MKLMSFRNDAGTPTFMSQLEIVFFGYPTKILRNTFQNA